MLEAQQRAIAHLAANVSTTPRVVPTIDGSSLVAMRGRRRQTTLRLGDQLARRASARERRASIARRSARSRPADRRARRDARRLRSSGASIATSTGISPNGTLDRRVEREHLLDRRVAARRSIRLIGAVRRACRAAARRACRARAIHNDLNDHNVLVGGDDDRRAIAVSASPGSSISATWCTAIASADLAIAIAYAMLERRDPLDVAARSFAATRERDASTTTSSRRCSDSSRCASARARASPPSRRAAAGQRVSRREPGADSRNASGARRRFRSGSPRRCFARRPVFAPCRRRERVSRYLERARRSRRCSASISSASRRSCSTLSIDSPLVGGDRATTRSRAHRVACSAR